MKNLITLALFVFASLTFNAYANNLTMTADYSVELSDGDVDQVKNENITKMSNRKIGKFLKSKKFDKDGSLENYLGGFITIEDYKVKRFKFYRNKETNEVIVINKKDDLVIRTGDFL